MSRQYEWNIWQVVFWLNIFISQSWMQAVQTNSSIIFSFILFLVAAFVNSLLIEIILLILFVLHSIHFHFCCFFSCHYMRNCFTNDQNPTKVINEVSYDWPIDSHSDTSVVHVLRGAVLMLWLTLSWRHVNQSICEAYRQLSLIHGSNQWNTPPYFIVQIAAQLLFEANRIIT